MAIKQAIGFLISFFGDGSSNSVTIPLSTSPILLQMACFGGGAATVAGFSLASSFPTSVFGVASEDGQILTATLDGVLKNMTITWPKAPIAGQKIDVTGYLGF